MSTHAIQKVERKKRAAQFRRPKSFPINGIVLLNKDLGASSQAAVTQIKQLFNAEKGGHTGTLDPMASGLLPICLGEATKFSQHLLDADKTYRAQICLGVRTDSGDASGAAIEVREPFAPPEISVVRQILDQFLGLQQQIPPMYSALKLGGKALYHYAREGLVVERNARQITIYQITLLHYQSPLIEIDVRCSKGTYIRTLAEDIGNALGLPAHLSALERSAVGTIALTAAYTTTQLQALMATPEAAEHRGRVILPVDYLIRDLPICLLSDLQTEHFQQGRTLSDVAFEKQGLVRVYSQNRSSFLAGFLGVGLREGRVLSPHRLCTTEPANARA